MKTIQKNIMRILGGIALMTTFGGCAFADDNNQQTTEAPVSSDTGASRTAEEAAVEAEFEPLFEFLAAEKKDFSNVATYVSSLRIRDKSSTNKVIEENSLVLESLEDEKGEFSGYFTEHNENVMKYTTKLESGGELVFDGQQPLNYSQRLYFMVIDTVDVKNGKVTGYSSNHSETELETLMYDLSVDISIFQLLIEQYHIQDTITGAALCLSKSGSSEYNARFYLYTNEKSYSLGMFVVFKN